MKEVRSSRYLGELVWVWLVRGSGGGVEGVMEGKRRVWVRWMW